MTDLKLAPRLIDELSSGLHRTAILIQAEPVRAGQQVRLCSTADPTPVATAEIDATISGTVEIVRQRIVDQTIGPANLPPLDRPEQLLERIPGDYEIDDPALTEFEPPFLRFLQLDGVQPIATDGGDNPFDDSEEDTQQIRLGELAGGESA